MAYLSEQLSELGFRVFIVPEVATMFITGGVSDIVSLAEENRERYLDVQRNLMQAQWELRGRYQALAGAFEDESCILLHDRGIGDDGAYTSKQEFLALLAECGLSVEDALDSYDGVIHMITAAKGAEAFYTLANNAARSESPELARLLDDLTLHAWIAHPHLKIIANDAVSFDGKLRNALVAVCGMIGIPEPLEIERKFLLAEAPDFTASPLADAAQVEIVQTYLSSDDPKVERRVRERQQAGQASYFLTEKSERSDGVRAETERIISPREALRQLKSADPARQPIAKTRYCFAHGAHRFELDVFHGSLAGLYLLEVELAEEGEHFELPPTLRIDRDVTDDRAFKNSALAVGSRT